MALSEAHKRVEEELEASLEQRYTESAAEGEWRFFYELQEMGRRAHYVVALETKAVDAVEMLRQDLYAAQLEQERLKEDTIGLLADLIVLKTERDEVVDDDEATILAKRDLEKALSDANTEVISLWGWQLEADSSLHHLAERGERVREKASMLSIELVAAKSEAEALRARVIDYGVNKAESQVEFDATRGEVSLLHGKVALLGSREAELLPEFEVARAEVTGL
ncbi:hypothetical protein ACLOJK_005577 [Asimina triloba]